MLVSVSVYDCKSICMVLCSNIYYFYFSESVQTGTPAKTWGGTHTLDNNTCVYCLEQNEVKLPRKKSKLNVSKVYCYESIDSFDFHPKLWEKVISFGFNPLHKLICCSENLAKMSEHKFAA